MRRLAVIAASVATGGTVAALLLIPAGHTGPARRAAAATLPPVCLTVPLNSVFPGAQIQVGYCP